MSDPADRRQLPLRQRHLDAGARMAPFAGWEMPLQYEGIIAEHGAVRRRAGVFDVSHMGRAALEGDDAAARLRGVTTYDVIRQRAGTAHYSLYCETDGGIADDVMIYRITEQRWLIVHNAANAAAGMARLREALGPVAEDRGQETVMLAVQGPEAREALRAVLGDGAADLKRRHCVEVPWKGGTVFVGRTGYTGEDGGECVADPVRGGLLWDALVADGVVPAGLGARDTLRLEAALPLHGQDISPATNPYEAGLRWVVTLEDGAPFTGREALARLGDAEPARRLSCLRLRERGVPRPGNALLDPASGETVATLTSGSFSPTLRVGIAMAYLPAALAAPGTPLAVRIRERDVAAEVVERPFYRHS